MAKILNLKLSVKLPLMIAIAAVFLAAGIGYLSTTTATDNAEAASERTMRAMLENRAEALSSYLESIEQDLRTLAASPMTADAVTEFQSGWSLLGDNAAGRLQTAYITDNPNPTGEKEKLDTAAQTGSYNRTHLRYHPWFRTFLYERGYYDIFLFDLEGNLIYSVFKELDYATNLEHGEYADTDLGNVYRAAAQTQAAQPLHFYDFEPYSPSHGAPASFISTPIYSGGEKIGVLAFQMPIDRINAVMGSQVGLGETGETLIVGSDGLMRNDSRFFEESTILAASVENEAVTQALAGEEGYVETDAYRDETLRIYSRPLLFHGTSWALIAAIATEEIRAPIVSMRNEIALVSLGFLTLIIFAGVFLARTITNPITALTGTMQRLAAGDLSVELAGENRHDEIGEMSAAVKVFRENALRTNELEKQQEEQRLRTGEDQKQMMNELADGFESKIGTIAEAVAASANQMHNTSQEMSGIAEGTSQKAAEMASASEMATSNVQTVAAAAEEMTASIAEINNQITEASRSATKAVQEVQSTQGHVKALEDTADSIGEVVSLISGIAEQTNLLALNATIESARAGEAGKGFAVVANEVKALANQTSQATEQISDQIQQMQGATGQTASSMEEVATTIEKLQQASSAIAAAMEEQEAVTQEIARSVQEAAAGSQQVGENITLVTQASQETGSASSDVMAGASELANQASDLTTEVGNFVAQVRSA